MVSRLTQEALASRGGVPAAMDALRTVREFVVTWAGHAGLTESEAVMLELGGVEVFTNIVRHAKGLPPGAPVELVVHASSQSFVLDIIHQGEAFTPPENAAIPDLNTFPEGGFGLTIIRNSCDCVDYLHHQGVNTVRMTRWITGSP